MGWGRPWDEAAGGAGEQPQPCPLLLTGGEEGVSFSPEGGLPGATPTPLPLASLPPCLPACLQGHTKCGAIKASVAEFVEAAKRRQGELADGDSSDCSPPGSRQQSPKKAQAEAQQNLQQQQQNLQQQQQSPKKAASADAQQQQQQSKGGFLSGLLRLLGGREAADRLVRTASFRC